MDIASPRALYCYQITGKYHYVASPAPTDDTGGSPTTQPSTPIP
jgi:hypothetical protein